MLVIIVTGISQILHKKWSIKCENKYVKYVCQLFYVKIFIIKHWHFPEPWCFTPNGQSAHSPTCCAAGPSPHQSHPEEARVETSLQPTGPSEGKRSAAHMREQGSQPPAQKQKDIPCEAEIRQLAGAPQHNQGSHWEELASYFPERQCRNIFILIRKWQGGNERLFLIKSGITNQ